MRYVGGNRTGHLPSGVLRDRQQMDAFYQLIEQYVQALLEIAARYEQAEARNRELAAARKY